jgi:hypothetical protein
MTGDGFRLERGDAAHSAAQECYDPEGQTRRASECQEVGGGVSAAAHAVPRWPFGFEQAT